MVDGVPWESCSLFLVPILLFIVFTYFFMDLSIDSLQKNSAR